VDLDGDGKLDVITGSWPGELYWFRGLGDGKFAAAEKIRDRDDKEIKVGNASTVFATDWRATGKLDLIVGNIEGFVYLIPNEGSPGKYAYGKPQKLKAAGKEIKVPHGDAGPVVADWDRDGKPDLIVGTGAGSVLWYRNIGSRQQPELAAAQTLVPESHLDWQQGLKPDNWGIRAKVCVTDWNGDGWPDILMGDFGVSLGENPAKTDADKAAAAQAEKAYQEALKPYLTIMAELNRPPAGETPEEKKKREEKISEWKERMRLAEVTLEKAAAARQKYTRRQELHGNVWLFLRKPSKALTAKP
jgi:hypothetical protein